MLAKREHLKGRKKLLKTNKKKCGGHPKHLFELLVIAIACVQRYIFYEKKAKTKKIVLTPCAIKLSFICHGFCPSQLPQRQERLIKLGTQKRSAALTQYTNEVFLRALSLFIRQEDTSTRSDVCY